MAKVKTNRLRKQYERGMEKAIAFLAKEYAGNDIALQDRILLVLYQIAEAHGVKGDTTLDWAEQVWHHRGAMAMPEKGTRGGFSAPPAKTRLALDYDFAAMSIVSHMAEKE